MRRGDLRGRLGVRCGALSGVWGEVRGSGVFGRVWGF